MSIEKALKDHTIALNRFCDFCEKYGVVPEVFNKVVPLSDSTPRIGDALKTSTEKVKAPVTSSQAEISDSIPTVSDEPTATAPVATETPAADTIEDLVIVADTPADEVEDSDVVEAPAVEETAKPITVNDVANSMKKLLPNRNAIVAVLDQFGVGKVTELKAEDLPKAKQLFDQALQGA